MAALPSTEGRPHVVRERARVEHHRGAGAAWSFAIGCLLMSELKGMQRVLLPRGTLPTSKDGARGVAAARDLHGRRAELDGPDGERLVGADVVGRVVAAELPLEASPPAPHRPVRRLERAEVPAAAAAHLQHRAGPASGHERERERERGGSAPVAARHSRTGPVRTAISVCGAATRPT